MEEPNSKLALLVTDDSAVESAVREAAAATGDQIALVSNHREALSLVIDRCGSESLAVVDVEECRGERHLLESAGGALPLLVITSHPQPWLTVMVRRRRIGAVLKKPFTTIQIRDAWQRLRGMKSRVGRSWS